MFGRLIISVKILYLAWTVADTGLGGLWALRAPEA